MRDPNHYMRMPFPAMRGYNGAEFGQVGINPFRRNRIVRLHFLESLGYHDEIRTFISPVDHKELAAQMVFTGIEREVNACGSFLNTKNDTMQNN